MIVQQDFLKKIKDFGLNSYEAKIWTALLSRGVSTAGELSDIANVPRSRSYDVLESLEKKGFIIMKIGKPIKYIAVPPEEVLERVKKTIQVDADKQAKTLDKLKGSDVLNELKTLHTKGVDLVEPTDLTGALKGRSNAYNQLDSMIKGAETGIILVTSEEGLTRKTDSLLRALKKASERGVKIQVAAQLTNKNKDAVATLKKYADVRNLNGIDARFCVVDSQEVMFMLLPDTDVHPSYDVGIWINTPYFAQALSSMFELAWKELKVKN
ncbi:TrmB family transcriptional regulator [Candidatus Woesearchaeota archaeon]|nr:TrmB family transcriptional regulator [Candidatus Woesearchaeota archaeon]